jgi:ribonuclease P protein component
VLEKKYRLTKKKDFKRVFVQGRIFGALFSAVKIKKNNLPCSRFGFVVSLKISKKAVERNKIRRRLQEAIRLNLSKIKKGVDVAVIAKPGIKGKQYGEIEEDLIAALDKAGIIK